MKVIRMGRMYVGYWGDGYDPRESKVIRNWKEFFSVKNGFKKPFFDKVKSLNEGEGFQSDDVFFDLWEFRVFRVNDAYTIKQIESGECEKDDDAEYDSSDE